MGNFKNTMFLNLKEEGFYDCAGRDSYGFDFLTGVFYGANVIRLNFGDHSQEQMDKLAKSPLRTLTHFAAGISDKEKTVDKI